MKFLVFFLLSTPLFGSEFSLISNKVQRFLTGTFQTSIPKKNFEFSGSDLNTELMFDVYIEGGQQRFCLYMRETKIKFYQSKKEKNCLGETIFEFDLKSNWAWTYISTRYLGKNIMTLRFVDKKSESFFDIRFPNIRADKELNPKLWDNPISQFPFGFAIYSAKPEFD